MPDNAVKLSHVTKNFPLYGKNPSVVRLLLRKKQDQFTAIKDVNLTIKRGERVGIVGPNGSGKTTLLKIIAGITAPTRGTVTTKGKVVSLMHLDAGFHPDLTGAENIYFNGLLIGMTKDEIKKKYDHIVRFAEIGQFIHAPFHTYSDGMKFRIAFAVATASACDVLIIDEIFLAGDMDFQLKTLSSIKAIQKQSNATIIICSHLLTYVIALSNTFYSLHNGSLRKESHQSVMNLLVTQDKQWTQKLGVTFGYLKNSRQQ